MEEAKEAEAELKADNERLNFEVATSKEQTTEDTREKEKLRQEVSRIEDLLTDIKQNAEVLKLDLTLFTEFIIIYKAGYIIYIYAI